MRTEFGYTSKSQCLRRLREIAPDFYEEELQHVQRSNRCRNETERQLLAMKRVSCMLADSWSPEVEAFWGGDEGAFYRDVIIILEDYAFEDVD